MTKLVFKCFVVFKEENSAKHEKCILIMGKPIFAKNMISKKNSRTIKKSFRRNCYIKWRTKENKCVLIYFVFYGNNRDTNMV